MRSWLSDGGRAMEGIRRRIWFLSAGILLLTLSTSASHSVEHEVFFEEVFDPQSGRRGMANVSALDGPGRRLQQTMFGQPDICQGITYTSCNWGITALTAAEVRDMSVLATHIACCASQQPEDYHLPMSILTDHSHE
jgi:hypothetical protein